MKHSIIIVILFSQVMSFCSDKKISKNNTDGQSNIVVSEPIIGSLDKVKKKKATYSSTKFIGKSGYCNLLLYINDELMVDKFDFESVYLRDTDGSDLIRLTDEGDINKLNINSEEITEYLNLIEFKKRNPNKKIESYWKIKLAIPINNSLD